MSETKEPILVAVDDGFADIKVAWFEDGQIKTCVSPSTAEHGWTRSKPGSSNEKVNAYQTGDTRFTIGNGVEPITTRFPDYYRSPLNRALIHHALYKAGFMDEEISIVTGVPPEQYHTALDRIHAEKAESLSEPVYRRFGADEKEVNIIVESDVGAQAISGYIDMLIDDQGNRNDSLKGESVAVVDIGGGTSDMIGVQDMDGDLVLIDKLIHTAEIGMLKVYESVKQEIFKKYSVKFSAREDLYELVQTNQLDYYGELIDISEIVQTAKKEVTDEIIENVKNRLREFPRIRKVIFIGGGAVALKENLLDGMQPYTVLISDDARFANAKGMLKNKKWVNQA